MAPPSNPNSRSARRRPASLVAAMTALAVAGTPTAALASGSDAHAADPGPDTAALNAAPEAEALSSAKPAHRAEPGPAPEPSPGEVASPEPEVAPRPAPVPSEPEPEPEILPAEPVADATPSTFDPPPAEAPRPAPAATEAPAADNPVAEAPAGQPEIVVTPARVILRGVDGSTVEIPFSTLPAPAVTTPAPTVIVPLPLPVKPSGDDEDEGEEGIDPSEIFGPAFPPGFWDDYDGPRLTWMGGQGAVPDPAAPADPAAAPAVAVDAATAGAEAPVVPTTLSGPAAAAPDILPVLTQPPLHGRGDAPPESLLADSPPAPPVRAIPFASSTRFTAEVIAAAARTRGDRPARLEVVASAAAGTAKATASAAALTAKVTAAGAVKAGKSPWLPFGLLALALLYLLGQRAMDRGSKLSYAGRPGEPDDELIEL